jgi:hypothetical protein
VKLKRKLNTAVYPECPVVAVEGKGSVDDLSFRGVGLGEEGGCSPAPDQCPRQDVSVVQSLEIDSAILTPLIDKQTIAAALSHRLDAAFISSPQFQRARSGGMCGTFCLSLRLRWSCIKRGCGEKMACRVSAPAICWENAAVRLTQSGFTGRT